MNARRVLTLVGVLVVLGTLGSAGLVVALVHFMEPAARADAWTEDAVPERDLPTLFSVRLPAKPVTYRSHFEGFQDGLWEVLVQLPPGGDEAFLRANGLSLGAEVEPDGRALEVIERFVPDAGGFRAREVPLPPPRTTSDGGVLSPPHRAAQLLEGPGGPWLWLSAFET